MLTHQPHLKFANLFVARRVAQRRCRRHRRREDRALFNRLHSAICRHVNDRGPSRSLGCMAVALRKSLYQTAEIFTGVYAPLLPSSPFPLPSAAACALDDPFTLPEFGAAIRLMRRRSASGPDRIPCQDLLNLPEAALLKPLQWYNEIRETGCVPPE